MVGYINLRDPYYPWQNLSIVFSWSKGNMPKFSAQMEQFHFSVICSDVVCGMPASLKMSLSVCILLGN